MWKLRYFLLCIHVRLPGLFFQVGFSILVNVTTFSGQLYFRKSYFITLLLSNYFDTAVTFLKYYISSEQQLFLRSSFFRTVASMRQLLIQKKYFFREEVLSSSHFLRIGSSLGQLLFRTAAPLFWWRNC